MTDRTNNVLTMHTTHPRNQVLLTQLIDGGIVAIIRTTSPDPVIRITAALLAGGVRAVEVTLTTPGALGCITTIADRFGDDVLVGVGSVLTAAQCRDAAAAGARYAISPNVDPAVIEAAKSCGILSIPGAYTPTEIVRATALGADLVKVFPATSLGPDYARDLLAPLPHLKLMPTGGVTPDNIGQWLSAGAVCAGVGSSLICKQAVASEDWDQMTRQAQAFRAAVTAARAD